MDEPHTVWGYHGTIGEKAEAILKRGFRVSQNEWDWLGTGIYFWQDAPLRAWEWADELANKRGSKPAVLCAKILLENCIDLLDIEWGEALFDFYQTMQREYNLRGIELPINLGKAHYLDKAVINHAVIALQSEYNISIRVVRGAFPEGNEIYPGSEIYDRNHVQIAVLDPELILQVRQLERGQD